MEQQRLTKKEIVDWIVAKATFGMFKGDKRDGETPPITVQNFSLDGVHPLGWTGMRLFNWPSAGRVPLQS